VATDPVKEFLIELQNAWSRGEVAGLARFYHPDVILLPPDLGPPLEGRQAVLDSYRDFLDVARLISFEITELEVFPFSHSGGATCMAHLHFSIRYELDGNSYDEEGLEIYTVLLTDAGPQIVWRSQTVLDSRLTEKIAPEPSAPR